MRTFIISKQIDADSAEEAIRLEKRAKLIGVVPAAPHVLEQLSSAIGTPLSDPGVEDPIGFKPKRRK